jgi:cytochrome c biogenesis protein ResB
MTLCYCLITKAARQYKQGREKNAERNSKKNADLTLLQVQTDHASKIQAI